MAHRPLPANVHPNASLPRERIVNLPNICGYNINNGLVKDNNNIAV
jgi:hypothetical protein